MSSVINAIPTDPEFWYVGGAWLPESDPVDAAFLRMVRAAEKQESRKRYLARKKKKARERRRELKRILRKSKIKRPYKTKGDQI